MTDQLASWPALVLQQILVADAQREQRRRLLDNHFTSTGLVFTSDYTGVWGDREALTLVLDAWARTFNTLPSQIRVAFARGCDIDPLAAKCLRDVAALSTTQYSCCIFRDVLDRLPALARHWVKAARPSTSDSRHQIVEALDSIQLWLMQNRSWVFDGSLSCRCETHQADCHVSGLALFHNSSDLQSRVCGIIDVDGDAAVMARPLIANVAGTSCLGWTRAGKQARWAHESEIIHAVWCTERISYAEQEIEDVFFQECSETYPYQKKLTEPMSQTHLVLHVAFGPELGGYPARRMRGLSAGLNLRTMHWHGPDPDQVQAHFELFFRRARHGNSDDWLCAPLEDINLDILRRAATRGSRASADSLQQLRQTDPAEFRRCVLPAGKLLNWQVYDGMRKLDATSWCADLDQDAVHGKSRAGETLPAQMRHSTSWSWSANRPLTSGEIAVAHGFPMFGHGDVAVSPTAAVLRSLSASQLQSLVGNGFHLPTMAAWLLYVLAHSTLKSTELAIVQLSDQVEEASHVESEDDL